MASLPIIDDVPKRIHEKLIAKQLLDFLRVDYTKIMYGDDSDGIPDIFVFKDTNLIYCIEVAGYIFGSIQDLQPNKIINDTLVLCLDEMTKIHQNQDIPYTIIRKKIQGGKQYKRFDNEKLLLLIHSDVKVVNDDLVFPISTPFGISPSCNNFIHYKDTIIKNLKNEIDKLDRIQWDQIWLIDYASFCNTMNSIKIQLK